MQTTQTQSIESKIENIIKDVENMTSAEFMSIISNMTRFYGYSFNNKLLLAFQNCSQVASFKKWQELNRQVKKGEKAKMILAPKIQKYKKEDLETGEEKELTVLKGFISVPVFDIAQTEGEEIEKNFTTSSNLEFDAVMAAAQKLNCSVEFKPLEIATGGYIAENRIVLNSNLNKIENTGTLIHEMAHFVLGHTDAADNDSSAVHEQEAETVTALICAEFGIERKSNFYLKSWGTQNILKALPKLSKAYSTIKGALE
jgi:antirestriction protein ArdC